MEQSAPGGRGRAALADQLVTDLMCVECVLGGCFRARLEFPPTYPLLPPAMTFLTPIFHPNVYRHGKVCISILHPPVDDKYGYETAVGTNPTRARTRRHADWRTRPSAGAPCRLRRASC